MVAYVAHLTVHEFPALLGWMALSFGVAALVSAWILTREGRDRP